MHLCTYLPLLPATFSSQTLTPTTFLPDTTLETNPDYLPGEASSPPAQQILLLSFDRNRAVRNALADWTEHCERVSLQSTSSFYTESVEYDTLLTFGQSIIPHVMLQYKRDVGVQGAGVGIASRIGGGSLFWYELLHELVWGRKTGLQTIVFGEIYASWEKWFEEGGAAESAPKFGEAA